MRKPQSYGYDFARFHYRSLNVLCTYPESRATDKDIVTGASRSDGAGPANTGAKDGVGKNDAVLDIDTPIRSIERVFHVRELAVSSEFVFGEADAAGPGGRGLDDGNKP